MTIQQLLQLAVDRNASDLHLSVGSPATLRIDGDLVKIQNEIPLTPESIDPLIRPILSAEQLERLMVNREIDLSISFSQHARFRANIYYQKGAMAGAFRRIPLVIPKMDELKLPQICQQFIKLKQGLVLVTGPTGHGKSTTIAAMLNEINQMRPVHIITIEDPVEFIFTPNQALISQREMGDDTHSWEVALRSCLREDPDIVLVGEMRDYETMAAAMTIAETGHLVFATLHTNSAAQSIDRIIDVFPEEQQSQVRLQLSSVIEGIISQRLVKQANGGRILAYELLTASSAVKNLIREGKLHLINNIIQTSAEMGMISLETVLADYVKKGLVTYEEAERYGMRHGEIARLIGLNSSGNTHT